MKNRLLTIKNQLKKQNLDATLISSVSNITYLTGYSGFSEYERGAFLLITTNRQYILTSKLYAEEIKKLVANFDLEEVSSSIPYRVALEKLIKQHKIKKLGIEVDNLTVSEYISLKKIFKSRSALIGFQISENRSIKDQTELDAIQRACNLTDKTFDYILTKIKSGITEKELAFEIEFFIKKHGGDLAFPSIVAFGKNSAVPHHKVTDVVISRSNATRNLRTEISQPFLGFEMTKRVLQTNEIILLDFGAKVDNYHSDMTRVVFLGKATEEQKKVYETVIEAQKCAIEYINNVILRRPSQRDDVRIPFTLQKPQEIPRSARNDIMASGADKAARDFIYSKGFGKVIYDHTLGHCVGLEIHEAPRLSIKSKAILKPGMVFTIEPGIYIPEKFGVRIEDLAVLENSGLHLLSHSPKNIIEL